MSSHERLGTSWTSHQVHQRVNTETNNHKCQNHNRLAKLRTCREPNEMYKNVRKCNTGDVDGILRIFSLNREDFLMCYSKLTLPMSLTSPRHHASDL